MKTLEEQIKDRAITRWNIKSKVKFQGDFNIELEAIVDAMQPLVAEQVIKNYQVEYTEYGTQYMKVKIKDTNLMIDKLIACNFTFKANDEKFGYVTPEFIVSGKSRKSKVYTLKKYPIWETENILRDVMIQLLEIVEEFD